MAFTNNDNLQVPTEDSAASRFGNNYDLLHYLAQHILNLKLLANLVLVSKGYHAIFTPRLWREMTDSDLHLVHGLDTTKINRPYIKKFTKLGVKYDGSYSGDLETGLPQMSNLESFAYVYDFMTNWTPSKDQEAYLKIIAFFNAPTHHSSACCQIQDGAIELLTFAHSDFRTTHTTLDLIRPKSPNIRELHLRFKDREPITPSILDGFTNLTSLILDNLDGLKSWNQWTTFLIGLVDASPRLQELGLFNLRTRYLPRLNGPISWHKPDHFRLLCEEFAKRNPDKRLRLRSLLLGSNVYPPGPLAHDYIQQLTDPQYLEHVHIGAAGELEYWHWDDRSRQLDRSPSRNTIFLPAFISPETTPRLRLISTIYNTEPVQEWLQDLHSRYPSFARNVSHRASTFHWARSDPVTFWSQNKREKSLLNQHPRLVGPLALPGHSKTFPYGLLALEHPTRSTQEPDVEQHLSQLEEEAPGPRDLQPAIAFKSLTLRMLWSRPGFNPIDQEILSQTRAHLLHTSSAGALRSLTVYPFDDSRRNGSPKRRSRMARAIITATMVELLNGLHTLEDLYFPLQRCKLAKEREADDRWQEKLILMLADEGILPRLRHVKIWGPCFEVVRGRDNGVVRLLELDANEEQRLEWFRDSWEARVDKSR